VSFIPWPVIEGFTLGIAVIIFLQQVPLITTPHHPAPGELSPNAVVAAVQSLSHADWPYLLWSVAAVAVVAAAMLLAPRLHRSLPGSLIGIVVVAVVAGLVAAPLTTLGSLPASLPAPALPALDAASISSLILPALTVAALAAIESLLSARVAASLADTGPYDPDRELIGQGLASIGAGMFGGMPATGAIARTAVNVRSGGRSRLAAVTHSLVLLLIVLFAATLVGGLPVAALAGVLMVTSVRMVHAGTVRTILRSTRADAIAFIATAVVTVSVDLIVAVVIGITVAVIFAIRGLARSTGVHREDIAGPPRPGDQRIAVIRIDGPLFFAAGDRVYDAVMGLQDVSVVVLRMSRLELVDATGARVLTDIVTALERRGVTVLIKGVQPGHEELFRTVGVLDSLRHDKHLFNDLESAVAHARSHVQRAASGAPAEGGPAGDPGQ
jgi:SulP family sulfate permease